MNIIRWVPFIFVVVLTLILSDALSPRNKTVLQRFTLYSAVFYFFSVATLCFTPLGFVGHHVLLSPAGIGVVKLQILQHLDPTFYLNIIMAVPLGIYYGLLIPRANILKVFLVGFLASSLVECGQYLLNHSLWLNRAVDINDVISNVLGVLIGYIILKIIGWILPTVVRRFRYFEQS